MPPVISPTQEATIRAAGWHEADGMRPPEVGAGAGGTNLATQAAGENRRRNEENPNGITEWERGKGRGGGRNEPVMLGQGADGVGGWMERVGRMGGLNQCHHPLKIQPLPY